MIPRPIYELQDMLGKHIDGQFYAEELSSVHVTKQMTYAIDKILRKRVRRGILEYLVRWRRYIPDFDSLKSASSVKHGMRENHFYVTLLSNSSQKLSDKYTSAFTIHLAQPIDLGSTEKWEVGVCEFSCHPD